VSGSSAGSLGRLGVEVAFAEAAAEGVDQGVGLAAAALTTSDGGAGVQANKAKGDAFRDEFADELEKNGYEVKKEVPKAIPSPKKCR